MALAGMVVGLVIRIAPGTAIQDTVSFDYQTFFNLLLPPIILGAGYELHQVSGRERVGRKTSTKRVAGELLPQHRHHLNLRIRWNVYFRRLIRSDPVAVDEDTLRRPDHHLGR